MTVMKIVLVGAAIIVLMAVGQQQRWAQRLGVVGVCTPTPAPSSSSVGYWYACKEGIVSGFPNLEADHCSNFGENRKQEIWSCDLPLSSLPGA